MPKMFIYGSCVSRDTNNFLPSEWERPTYIARQSMISAASGKAIVRGKSRLDSAFQNRMVENDIAGTAIDRLETLLQNHDVLLLDLIDERRGVFEVAPGKFVTRSNEMIRSGLMKQQLVAPRPIDFGTEEHWSLWKESADQIIDIIRKREVLALAVTPPWASVSNEGVDVRWRDTPVPEMNRIYSRYNGYLADSGIRLVTIPESEAIADHGHRWGLSAFHYVEGVYLSLRDQILAHYEGQDLGLN